MDRWLGRWEGVKDDGDFAKGQQRSIWWWRQNDVKMQRKGANGRRKIVKGDGDGWKGDRKALKGAADALNGDCKVLK